MDAMQCVINCRHLKCETRVRADLQLQICTAQPSDIKAALERIKTDLGSPEVLIYNAGPGGLSWPPPGRVQISKQATCILFAVQDSDNYLPTAQQEKPCSCLFWHTGVLDACSVHFHMILPGLSATVVQELWTSKLRTGRAR